jgi:uncharacterized membrane protein YedE/YeeE
MSARAYTSPYLAGLGVGVVLVAAFAVTGHGLGASGAFSSVVAAAASATSPAHVAANPSYDGYALDDWLVFEVLGIAIGGFASAAVAGRLRAMIERGSGATTTVRLTAAVAGGIALGFGAKLARGCTSGLGLSGGAVLSVGAWLFIVCAFGAAYLAAPLVRRLWL